jgi:L-fucose mutarotase/ribose pyranase (RbsD/FucU family)
MLIGLDPLPSGDALSLLRDMGQVAGPWPMGSIERFRFYEEARACVAVLPTLERRPYANMILTKGVLCEDGAVLRPDRPIRRPRGLRP